MSNRKSRWRKPTPAVAYMVGAVIAGVMVYPICVHLLFGLAWALVHGARWDGLFLLVIAIAMTLGAAGLIVWGTRRLLGRDDIEG
jgi:hypothetical protein